MEKLGVVLEPDKTKTAEKGTKKCPKCGRELVENNQFLMFCNTCGTEPFEKRP